METFIEKVKNLTSKQVMLLAVEQQKKLQQTAQIKREPLAIVGASCRMPGGANTLESYWELIANGKSAIISSHHERWDMSQFYHPDPSVVGKILTDRMGLVDAVEYFDAGFFGISPKEAERMDPQQRLLLETTWHALEHAGLVAKDLHGTRTGVFIGICNQDYTNLRVGVANRIGHHTVSPYDGTGTTLSVAAGRIAYFLGLQGPCFTLDTACSSSLVAIHLASQSLQSGESDLAICGGVNLILDPTISIVFAKANMLAPDGRCKTFDARADGYVRGEGCGVVIIKRLSDAQKAGDRILGVVMGSAINQDGASQGMTAPNELAQVALLQDALSSAGLNVDDIDYIEAHGTGTPLGDPIEMSALATVFAQRQSAVKIRVGSVKTNIGHTESASGMAGLLKVLLSMQHEVIPPHINFSQPSPLIPWQSIPLEVPQTSIPWRKGPKTRYAGVSSFGFSGSNAHLVIAEPPPPVETSYGHVPELNILPLSAKNQAALQKRASDLATFIIQRPELDLLALAAAARARSHFNWRSALVFDGRESLLSALEHGAIGEEMHGVRAANCAFLFSGQGSQYLGMAQQLYQQQPYYRKVLDECAGLLDKHMDIPLSEVLWGNDLPRLNNTAYTQPALFAVQYSLARLWQHWGVQPGWVIGHSVGEYVAACIAGVFSLPDALKLIAARGRLMMMHCQPGEMSVVFSDEQSVRQLLLQHGCRLDIAAVNGNSNTVVSGEQAEMTRFITLAENNLWRVVPLAVSHAFHSAMMEPMLAAFKTVAESISFHLPAITVISNVTGRAERELLCHADYWVSHVRAPVYFANGVGNLFDNGVTALVEVGPGSSLLAMAKTVAVEKGDAAIHAFPSLGRNQRDLSVLLTSLAGLYQLGVHVDWAALYPGTRGLSLDLPGYPFQRSRYWLAQHTPGESWVMPLGEAHDTHPLCGSKLQLAGSEKIYFDHRIDVHHPSYMGDHRLYGLPVVAGASHTAAMLQVASIHYARQQAIQLSQVAFARTLLLRDAADGEEMQPPNRVQLVLSPQSTSQEAAMRVELFSQGADGEWSQHASATMAPVTQPLTSPVVLSSLQQTMVEDISAQAFYQNFWDKGYTLGNSFRWFGQGYHGDNRALRELVIAGRVELDEPYLIYPGLLDACFQVVERADFNLRSLHDPDTLFVPFQIAQIQFCQPLVRDRKLFCYTELLTDTNSGDGSRVVSDIWLLDEDNQVIVCAKGFEARRVRRETLQSALLIQPDPVSSGGVFSEQWQALESPKHSPAVRPRMVLVNAALRAQAEAALGDSTLRPLWVSMGDTFSQQDRNITLSPTDPQQWQQLWHIAQQLHSGEWDLVYLWGLVMEEKPNDDRALWQPLLHSLQQLIAQQSLKFARLLFVSMQGRQVAVAETIEPLQSMLWGVIRSVRLEQSALTMQLVDLAKPDDLSALATLLGSHDPSLAAEQLAVRDGQFFACRLLPVTEAIPTETMKLSADKCYLITGGLGGLGLGIVQTLLAQGARQIALLSRRPADVGQQADFAALAARWQAQIHFLCADVADADALASAVAGLLLNSPLGGIIHAAGVLRDAMVDTLSEADFAVVTRAKVQGAINLHNLTSTHPVDFFVMYSSFTAACGAPGQSSYGAANAFMDGLAWSRRQQGLPAVSLQWGPWRDSGMAARLDQRHQDLMAAKGIGGLSNSLGIEVLHKALQGSYPIVGLIVNIDWERYVAALPDSASGIPPIFTQLVSRGYRAPQRLLEELNALSGEARSRYLRNYLQALFASTLGFQDQRQVKSRARLFDMGLDSLLALDLKSQLEKALACRLSNTLLFDYPTLEKLAEYLEGLLAPTNLPDVIVCDGEEVLDEESMVALLSDTRLDSIDSLTEKS